MFRSHRRLFKTVKLLGMTYRLTRNVLWDFFRQLRLIWKDRSTPDKELMITDYYEKKKKEMWN
jgi:hypothetical protein